MKKIAITGHTQGIGKYLYDKYAPNCQGFSLSTGFDIRIPSDRKKIIDAVSNCDVFINNATSEYSQTDMLVELFECWSQHPKLIINIGSDTTDGIKSHIHKYTFEKAALNKASTQLSFLKRPCVVTNIRFGWVGNDRVIKNFNPPSVISLDNVYFIINNVIDTYSKFRTTEILIQPL